MNKRIITLLLVLCVVVTSTMAQQRRRQNSKAKTEAVQAEPKVLSMKMATASFIAASDQRKDNNGDLCALVKVQVLDDFTEESSSIGDVVTRGAEKWVYIYKGAKRMKLFFKNNLPLTVTFSDYGIQSIESNRVYELKIQVPNVPEKADMPDGTLRLGVTPANADITLWGDNLTRKSYRAQDDGTLTLTLPWGRYYYLVEAPGYRQAEGSVFVNDEGSLQRIDLAGNVGTLTLTSPTDKVELTIDNQPQGTLKKKKSLKVELRPGDHTITLSRKGYVSQTQNISILSGEAQTVELPALLSEYDAKLKAKREEKTAKAAVKKEKKAEAAEIKKQQNEAKRQALAEQKIKDAEKNQKKKEERARKMAVKEKQTVVLGLTAGYSMPTASFKSGDTESLSSFHIGLTADFRLANNFYLNSALIYNKKGYIYKNYDNSVDEEGTPQYVDIPLQASVRVPLSTMLKLEFCAGPYVAFCIGGNVTDRYYYYKAYDESFSSTYGSMDYGVQGNVGLIFQHHFRLSVGYQFGLASDYQNRCLMVGLGYRF